MKRGYACGIRHARQPMRHAHTAPQRLNSEMSKKQLPKTAFITGAAAGIGRAYALECASRGIELVCADINSEGLDVLKSEIQEKYSIEIHTIVLDMSQADSPKKCLDYCDQNCIEIDLLINNAGIFIFDPFLDADINRIELMINLHIACMTRMCRLFGERMKSRRFGYILNMSSMSVWMMMPGINVYNASKAYIRGLSRSLYFELKPYNVGVTAICPAGVDTQLLPLPDKLRKIARNTGFLMNPAKLVRLALNATLKKKIQSIPGILNNLFAFFMMILPNWLIEFVAHRLPSFKRFWPQ